MPCVLTICCSKLGFSFRYINIFAIMKFLQPELSHFYIEFLSKCLSLKQWEYENIVTRITFCDYILNSTRSNTARIKSYYTLFFIVEE